MMPEVVQQTMCGAALTAWNGHGQPITQDLAQEKTIARLSLATGYGSSEGIDGNTINDVWSSPNGITWTQATNNAGFSKRDGHSSVVYDDKIWVIGGVRWSRKRCVEQHQWHELDTSATNAAAFGIRQFHSSVVHTGKIWVIGGFDGSINHKDDVWSSPDGITWTSEITGAGFSGRFQHSSVVHDNKIWVIGGQNW